jgi:hypothetical protein
MTVTFQQTGLTGNPPIDVGAEDRLTLHFDGASEGSTAALPISGARAKVARLRGGNRPDDVTSALVTTAPLPILDNIVSVTLGGFVSGEAYDLEVTLTDSASPPQSWTVTQRLRCVTVL